MPSSPVVTSGTRFHSLDSLRAAMMLLGICLHAAVTYTTVPLPIWPFKDPRQSPVCDFLVFFIHSFRMPLFFVLAGLFARMIYNRRGPSGFLRHRVRRILVPFVVAWLVLYIPVNAGMVYGVTAFRPDPWDAVERFFRSGAALVPLRTLHLWFLYYLLHFYVVATVLSALAPRLMAESARERFQGAFRRIANSRLRPLLLAVPTCATLYFMRSGGLDTNGTLLITPASLIAYSLFFGFGWFLFCHTDLIAGFQRHAWTQVALAMVLLPVNAKFTGDTLRALPQYKAGAHTIAIVTGSLIIWLLVFGFMGLAQRYLATENKRIRYVADASYWMYLVHLPIVLWLQVAILRWQAPGLIKFAVVMAATTAIALGSYHFLVRYTVIGAVLNGVRHRRADTPTPAPQPASV